jgi:hypothetical protein
LVSRCFGQPLFWLAAVILFSSAAQAATNSLTIKEEAGVSTTNYPVQIGRPFVQSEIQGCPQVVLDGTPVPTQADFKNKWPDGSVKFAVISFLIPQLNASSQIAVTFQDQGSCNNTPLTQAEMLDPSYNFEAQEQYTGASTLTASARAMLSAGAYKYWTAGPIATTIILADHSAARAFDIGFDSFRSIRPSFIATFWPALHKVKLRFIGENTNTETLEDVSLNQLTMTLGQSNPNTVYSTPKSPVLLTAMSRWTRSRSLGASGDTLPEGSEFWIGGAPSKISMNPNLDYLRQTTFVFNYDTSKIISDSHLAIAYDGGAYSWRNQARDLYDGGLWDKGMGDPGARPDIAPYPEWHVEYLYTGDWRSAEIALGQTDLAASWAFHLREGNASKNVLRSDGSGSGTGLGLPMSISNRTTYVSGNMDFSYTAPQDRVTPVGPASAYPSIQLDANGWGTDDAHHPDPWSVPYILTGDFYDLEELWFSASYLVAFGNPFGTLAYGRGPTGAEGGLANGQLRAVAWTLRNLAHAAFLTPDGLSMKSYFTTLLNDFAAIEEGARNITSSLSNSSNAEFANWTWGHTTRSGINGGWPYPPLHMWVRGSTYFVQGDYGIAFQKGNGTLSAVPSGSVATLTFSDLSDCVALKVGEKIYIPDIGITPTDVASISCPMAVVNGGVSFPAGTSFVVAPTVSEAASLFEMDFLMLALGRATELGYPMGNVANWLGQLFVGALTDPGYNPYLIASGRIPTTSLVTGQYFQTFSELKTGYNAAWQTKSSFDLTTPDNYEDTAMAATSMAAGVPGGAAAWQFMNDHLLTINPTLSDNPRWAILPRAVNGTPPPPDTQPPTTPAGLQATAQSASEIQLVWTASTDNVGVIGYNVYRNGQPIGTASNAGYFDSGLAAGTAFSYRVNAFDAAGNTSGLSNTASATTFGTATPPSITTQPQSASANPGQTANFSVTASGSGTLSYQWQVKLAGTSTFVPIATNATSPIYTTPVLALSDNGNQYNVIVSNSVGPTLSNAATLTVTNNVIAPTITQGPQSQAKTVGDTVVFTVTANGTAPLVYQWQYLQSSNWVTVGTNNPSYTLTNVQLNQNGLQYRCVVTNGAGSIQSAAATLTVTSGSGGGNPPPPVPVSQGAPLAVKVYPNPWRSDKHGTKNVTFDGLVIGTTIKIFTVSGHKIKELHIDGPKTDWDLTNDNGDKVASGVYMYLVTDTAGDKVKGKVAVIK